MHACYLPTDDVCRALLTLQRHKKMEAEVEAEEGKLKQSRTFRVRSGRGRVRIKTCKYNLVFRQVTYIDMTHHKLTFCHQLLYQFVHQKSFLFMDFVFANSVFFRPKRLIEIWPLLRALRTAVARNIEL